MDILYERFCFPVTFQCNLKCKLCAEHAPYTKRPYHPELKELKKELDELFRLVKHIKKFDITGGEPFLRKDLAIILEYLRNNYFYKIDVVRVTTNGTKLLPDGFIDEARKWANHIYVIVDNYAVSDKSELVYHALKNAGIQCELRNYSTDLHCDGWVDYGDLSLKHSREEAKKLFQKCMVPKLGFFTCMTNGMIFPCARARLLYERFIAQVGVDLFDPALSDEGKRFRMKELLEEEVIEACRFCNGLCEDSPRFMPAEQLTISRAEAQKQMEYEDWRLDYGKVLFYTQTYNNEKTIARTIESVLNQSNQNFTYFVCNNASNDRTGEIIQQYAKKSDRIIYVKCDHNDILGVCLIPYALFPFVPRYLDFYYTIVDGDDSVEPDFLTQVYHLSAGVENKPDMIVSSVQRIDTQTGQIINKRHPQQDIIISNREKVDKFMDLRPLLLAQWGKVHRWNSYRKYKNILLCKYTNQMPKWIHTSDCIGILSVFYQCNSVGFIAKPTYNYYISTSSVYHNYYPDRVKADELTFKIYNDFLDKYPPVSSLNRDYCYAIYFSYLEDTLNSILQTCNITIQQKLLDILSMLQAKTTYDLFKRHFNPIFKNLSHKETLIESIRSYLGNTAASFSSTDTYKKIDDMLTQYYEFVKRSIL